MIYSRGQTGTDGPINLWKFASYTSRPEKPRSDWTSSCWIIQSDL